MISKTLFFDKRPFQSITQDIRWLLYALLIKLLYTFITSYIVLPQEAQTQQSPFGNDMATVFAMVVFLIPALETLVFQFAIIEISQQIRKTAKSLIIALLLSGLLFGLMHFTSLAMFLIQIISGLMYAVFYAFSRKNTKVHAFVFTFSVHALHNLVGFLINELT